MPFRQSIARLAIVLALLSVAAGARAGLFVDWPAAGW